jgi:hypothetical protein
MGHQSRRHRGPDLLLQISKCRSSFDPHRGTVLLRRAHHGSQEGRCVDVERAQALSEEVVVAGGAALRERGVEEIEYLRDPAARGRDPLRGITVLRGEIVRDRQRKPALPLGLQRWRSWSCCLPLT